MGIELLGPFLGHVTEESIKIWLFFNDGSDVDSATVYVSIHPSKPAAAAVVVEPLRLARDQFYAGCATIEGLEPDSVYYYRIWRDAACSQPLDLQGADLERLEPGDLRFRTLPSSGYDERLDFVLMSCHGPTASRNDGLNGFAFWSRIPEILANNVYRGTRGEETSIRFALMVGDQVYADDVESTVLQERDHLKRQQYYLQIYREHWSDIRYRKILCGLPAYLMWDDHDITDGWGSREDSFIPIVPSFLSWLSPAWVRRLENIGRWKRSNQFKSEWLSLFATARRTFQAMQAVRNPPPLSSGDHDAFDTCFRVGRAGFVMLDLRSHRNIQDRRIMAAEQLENVKRWITDNREHIGVLFVISSVVFSHGAPCIDSVLLRLWFWVVSAISLLRTVSSLRRIVGRFIKNVGDLRDDINDSWSQEQNATEADAMLDYLFSLQNPPAEQARPLQVVILSGDIHAGGYATLYSKEPAHQACPLIPHITSSPVAQPPFSWLGEAIYRRATRDVKLGTTDRFYAQLSHHFCRRNVVVVSLREFAKERFLKIKYYVEGFPEPQITQFDLDKKYSHREGVTWPPRMSWFASLRDQLMGRPRGP